MKMFDMLSLIWDAVPKVQSSITLITFLVAAALTGFYFYLGHRERVLKGAPPEQRREMVDALNKFFHVDTSNLSPEQKLQLALAQVRTGNARLLMWLVFFLLMSLVFAGWTVYSTVQNLVSFEGKLGSLVSSMKDDPNSPAVTNSSDVSDFWVSSTTAASSRALILRLCETNVCLACKQEGATIQVSADGRLKTYKDKNGTALKRCQ
ncbi:hypothetical protein [Mesorhizobium sp. AA22]|uniref:hypothetical protein n=1 Tax=Mesorhizobium sp. AA22 TaxID=1854057 RepID=UPI0007ED2C64|nr:hypothetical protein [Mesorhizobium sp. AA22]QIA23648.1 hypothetical protein A9K68_019065 [Mesorhizobium sp. AA22]